MRNRAMRSLALAATAGLLAVAPAQAQDSVTLANYGGAWATALSQAELKPIEKNEERLKVLLRLIKRKDVADLVNACDAGREGELIFRYIAQFAKTGKPIRRLWLQSNARTAKGEKRVTQIGRRSVEKRNVALQPIGRAFLKLTLEVALTLRVRDRHGQQRGQPHAHREDHEHPPRHRGEERANPDHSTVTAAAST